VELSKSTQGNVAVISVSGRLDSKSAPSAQAYLEEVIDEHRMVVLDLGSMLSLSSAGLRVLLLAHRQAERTGTSMTLADVGPNTREVLTATGFSTFFAMADTVEDGVKALAA
jgi:anti-sigma B factor antagonist